MQRFDAPWNRSLIISTILVHVLCLGIPVVFALSVRFEPRWAWFMPILIPPLILAGCALFMIRGYLIVGEELLVQRLGWQSRLNLRELQSAEVDPNAFKGVIRTCGMSGCYCHCGWFYSRRLGKFRAWATHSGHGVVLKVRGKTWVVTPDDPQRFIEAVKVFLPRDRAAL